MGNFFVATFACFCIIDLENKKEIKMKNKLSVWSLIILITTIASLILLAISIILSAVGIPTVMAVAKQTAIDQGLPEADVTLAVNIAVIILIVTLVLASIFDILKVIGGFMFSLKGKWGMFCIVMAIISVVSTVLSLISDIRNRAGIGDIIVNVVSIVVSLIYCYACFKHRAEVNQQAA